ncbi:MAG: hypothetical protein LBM96_10765 [Methanobrevibacter sp.]|nr:hypothetical protein [Candidatus Methanoflexus mossambicus]
MKNELKFKRIYAFDDCFMLGNKAIAEAYKSVSGKEYSTYRLEPEEKL